VSVSSFLSFFRRSPYPNIDPYALFIPQYEDNSVDRSLRSFDLLYSVFCQGRQRGRKHRNDDSIQVPWHSHTHKGPGTVDCPTTGSNGMATNSAMVRDMLPFRDNNYNSLRNCIGPVDLRKICQGLDNDTSIIASIPETFSQ
jgi:hypothetical protein